MFFLLCVIAPCTSVSLGAVANDLQLNKVLSETSAGGVLNIELIRYANGLRKMLADQIDVQLEGSQQIKASSNCLDLLGYEDSMVDSLKNKIFKSLIVSFDDMDRIDHVAHIERTIMNTDNLLDSPSLEDCSLESQQLVN